MVISNLHESSFRVFLEESLTLAVSRDPKSRPLMKALAGQSAAESDAQERRDISLQSLMILYSRLPLFFVEITVIAVFSFFWSKHIGRVGTVSIAGLLGLKKVVASSAGYTAHLIGNSASKLPLCTHPPHIRACMHVWVDARCGETIVPTTYGMQQII